jgi:ribosomal-protein-serine acetyltransferase
MFVIDADTALRVLREDDAAELFALTEVNRVYLRRWLPWLDVVTAEKDTRAYLATVAAQRESGRGITFGIVCAGALAGVVGFHRIDRVHRSGDIGYWLAERQQGRGVMTECCRFVVRYGFQTLDLNRIQIAAATVNRRSRAIPDDQRLPEHQIDRAAQLLRRVDEFRSNAQRVFIPHTGNRSS